MASKKLILILVGLAALGFGAAGCGSDDDNPAAPPVDTAPPALPSGLAVSYVPADQTVTVTWDANVTDHDLEGYLVSRSNYDLAPVDLTAEPQEETSYEDANLSGCGRYVTYYVYCVDHHGNVSAGATISVELYTGAEPANRAQQQF
ncbi:MAG TPA: hypothetical protein PLL30_10165 [Candidatus Krumholzibacteria bacterium]|nr:hypothetical protein [Candidatus Krumholzibacteria bacterium]HPD72125.1 hypothetical protein [Candidatus Krumholzibacteria bacterium]HRY40943.1 hypothetical protein [Candidatus Krumholzibacteria bacterium]